MEPKQELLRRIEKVRKRWSRFIWFKGLAWVLGVGVVGLLVSMSIAESQSFPGWAVIALRVGLLGALIGIAAKMLVLPLMRKPDEIQLARFVEEKNPGLEDRLVSAVEQIQKPRRDSGPFGILLIRDALDRTRRIRFDELVNRQKYNIFATLSGVFVLGLIFALYFAATFFPYGSSRLFAGFVDLPPGPVYSIEITPGETTVPSGSDVVIEAVMLGFDPERAEIQVRYDNSSQWEASTMEVAPETIPTFRHLLFNVREPIRYFVRADGNQSEEYVISVADLPRVESVDYTYHFPAYTQMPSRTEEDAFDMVALRGTEVDVTIHASQELASGQIVFGDGQELELTPGPEMTAVARVTVDRSITFRIRLVNTDEQPYVSLTEYAMEALDDQKPIVQFTEPGRDHRASTVEEVFTELEATDDMGIATLELHFGVNGGEEQRLNLFSNAGTPPKEISGSYTFFLEEYEIEPGDFITYYGTATDSNSPPNSTTTDIYFIEVRPFGMEYFQGQGGGGGGGGGGGAGDSAEALSNRQKQIIAATFALTRDVDEYDAEEYSDNIQAVAENQTTLAEQTETLMGRLTARQLTRDEMIAKITENLELALEQMAPAAQALNEEDLEAATPFEHKSLQYLSRAEALFNQVQVSQGGGGGGGGGGGQNAQDLADLFDLELDQSQNQYETLEQAEGGQGASEEVDEALRKLQELAQRQQRALEEQRRQAQQGNGSGSASQEMTAEEIRRETERLARELDRLSRERNDPQMAEVAQSLNQAAQNMRNAQGGTGQQQQQAAEQALEELQRAERLLSGASGGTPEERLASLQRDANELAEEQRDIADQTERLAADPQTDAQRRIEQITEQKEAALDDLRDLQEELDAIQNADLNREASRDVRSAANAVRSNRLADKMVNGQQLLDQGRPDYAALREREIADALEDVEQQLSQAVASAADTEEQQLQTALNETSEAIRRLEAMQRRFEDGLQNRQEGQQGQQGQEGQQGEGQEGQQGEGQEGQQGQGQQGQQGRGGRGQQQGGNQQGGAFGGPDGGRPDGNFFGPGTDVRQITREWEQRLRDLEAVRDILGPENAVAADLNVLMNEIRQRLDGFDIGDLDQIRSITDDIIDPLRSVQLAISRELGLMLGRENIRVAQDDEIPANYREIVEEYYERLANEN